MRALPPRVYEEPDPLLYGQEETGEEVPIGEVLQRALHGFLKRFYYLPIFLLLGLGTAFVAYRKAEPHYTSSVSIQINRRSPLTDNTGGGGRGHLASEAMWFTYRPVVEELLEKTGLEATTGSPGELRHLIESFQKDRIRASIVRDTSIIRVSCYWSAPEMARQLVATLADIFIERYEKYNQDEMDRQTAFLARQVQDIRQDIETKEASLSEFQKAHGLLTMQDGVRSFHESLTTLETELGRAEIDLKTLLYKKEDVQNQLDSLGGSSPVRAVLLQHLVNTSSPLYVKLKEAEGLEKAVALLKQRATALDESTPDTVAPRVGGISPVNEALRLSLVSVNSPLRAKLEEVVTLERQIKTLKLQYMDNHPNVMLAKAQLREASQEARKAIMDLDPRGLTLYDDPDVGAAGLIFQSLTWQPGLPAGAEQLEPTQKRLAALSEEIRQLMRPLDPEAVELYDQYGAGYLLSQASAWQSWGLDSSSRVARLKETLSDLSFNEQLTRNRIEELQQNIEKTTQWMGSLPTNQALLEGKVRELQVLRNLYTMLQERLATASIEARSNMWQVEIMDPPYMPNRPDAPNPKKYFGVGGMLGLLLGFGLPLLFEFTDDRIRKPEQIEKRLGLSVLATLPKISRKQLSPP